MFSNDAKVSYSKYISDDVIDVALCQVNHFVDEQIQVQLFSAGYLLNPLEPIAIYPQFLENLPNLDQLITINLITSIMIKILKQQHLLQQPREGFYKQPKISPLQKLSIKIAWRVS